MGCDSNLAPNRCGRRTRSAEHGDHIVAEWAVIVPKRREQRITGASWRGLKSNPTLMEPIRRLVDEQIISSFAEQLSKRSSQSLQLPDIHDV